MSSVSDILLVEDDPGNVKLILLALDDCRLSSRLFIVRDGEEALEYLRCTGRHADRTPDAAPKLLMLDLRLPRMTGIEVLREMKRDPALATIPTVAFTSSDSETDIAECYRLGVNSYVVKPVELDRFFDSVRQVALYWLKLNAQPKPQEPVPAPSEF